MPARYLDLVLPARAYYTFRVVQPFPVPISFPSVCYFLEIFAPPHVGGSLRLILREPGQKPDCARILPLPAAVPNLILCPQAPIDVERATLAETIFLRMVRDGSAEMLAGLHCRVPQRLPDWIDSVESPP